VYTNIKTFLGFVNESLSGAREKYLNTGLITKEEFSKLLQIDKTPTNKFIEAICRFYIECGKDMDFIKSNLETYKALLTKKIKGFQSDINSFSSFSDWCEYMQRFSEYFSKTELRKKAKVDAKVLLDNNDWFIVQPLTWESSKLYGVGTKWCTSSNKSSADWEQYYNTFDYNMYYITDKNREPVEDPQYKIAIISTGEAHEPFHLFDALNIGIKDKTEILNWMKMNGFNPSMFKPKRVLSLEDEFENI
jgi:hypothetical protein